MREGHDDGTVTSSVENSNTPMVIVNDANVDVKRDEVRSAVWMAKAVLGIEVASREGHEKLGGEYSRQELEEGDVDDRDPRIIM